MTHLCGGHGMAPHFGQEGPACEVVLCAVHCDYHVNHTLYMASTSQCIIGVFVSDTRQYSYIIVT